MKPTDQDHLRLLERDVESDTKILSTNFLRVDGIPLLIETWKWEAIHGSSAVFLAEHVAGMNDANLQKFLTEQARVDLSGGVTISRDETHVFVNFGFVAN